MLVACVCFSIVFVWNNKDFDCKEQPYRLEIVKVAPAGYGYHIFKGEKLLIKQPFIPAVSGRKTFESAEDAGRVGSLVIKRMNKGEYFTISESDLVEQGVRF